MTVVVHMVGNAHLDPVWLWGWQAGGDEVLATFRAAADRLDEYPEFVFTAGEAWRYELVDRLDPELAERVAAHVASGRWAPVGDQYIQPDCNLPTRTALLRQHLRGQRYFAERFGTRSTVGFNVDTFGHPAALPDILVEAGLTAYAFHRPSREQLPLPGGTFRWRGPAGGEVIACRIAPAYVTRSSDLGTQIEIALERSDPALGHAACFYGVGDHGGGPTKKQIEYILANRDAFEGAELRFSTPQAYFDAVGERPELLPVVEGELQHVFPGCYSVMHEIKQAQRRSESALEQAGAVVAALASGDGERAAWEARLDGAWDDVLFTAFHDILAGTSIDQAWPSVRAMQGRAQIVAEEVVFDATRRAARRDVPTHEHVQVLVYNPDAEPWRGVLDLEPWIDLDVWGARWVSDVDGRPLAYQLADAECDAFMVRTLLPVEVPPAGWLTLLVRDDAPPPAPAAAPAGVTASPSQLAAGEVRAELTPSGLAGVRQRAPLAAPAGGRLGHLDDDLRPLRRRDRRAPLRAGVAGRGGRPAARLGPRRGAAGTLARDAARRRRARLAARAARPRGRDARDERRAPARRCAPGGAGALDGLAGRRRDRPRARPGRVPRRRLVARHRRRRRPRA